MRKLIIAAAAAAVLPLAACGSHGHATSQASSIGSQFVQNPANVAAANHGLKRLAACTGQVTHGAVTVVVEGSGAAIPGAPGLDKPQITGITHPIKLARELRHPLTTLDAVLNCAQPGGAAAVKACANRGGLPTSEAALEAWLSRAAQCIGKGQS